MKPLPSTLWVDGSVVPYQDATIHVLSTAVKYGAVVFEGVRAYWNEDLEELFVFRLFEHLDRLSDSLRISGLDLPYSIDSLAQGTIEILAMNDLKTDIHIRIMVLVVESDGGLASKAPLSVVIAPIPLARYPEARTSFDRGLDVQISHWQRVSDASHPPRVKSSGNYVNGRLALLQARVDGYDDAILLDRDGHVSEGPGYNIFLRRGDAWTTPPVTDGILEGVTRASIISILEDDMSLKITERSVDKTELYVCEEAFFCGSAKEIAPISSFDRRLLAACPGQVTEALMSRYDEVVRGKALCGSDRAWLTPVYGRSTPSRRWNHGCRD